MTIRKQLVVINGTVQELPNSDVVLGVASSNSDTVDRVQHINTSTTIIGTYIVDATVTLDGNLGVI
jgi:hypothetical protein